MSFRTGCLIAVGLVSVSVVGGVLWAYVQEKYQGDDSLPAIMVPSPSLVPSPSPTPSSSPSPTP